MQNYKTLQQPVLGKLIKSPEGGENSDFNNVHFIDSTGTCTLLGPKKIMVTMLANAL